MGQQINVLVGTTKGLFCYQSDAVRRQWQLRGPFLAGWEIYSVLGDSRHGQRIFAGRSRIGDAPSLCVSGDFGETWRQIKAAPHYPLESGFALNRFWQIVPGHASEPDTIFAGAEEAGLFVSRDRGESWQELDGLTKHPTRPDLVPRRRWHVSAQHFDRSYKFTTDVGSHLLSWRFSQRGWRSKLANLQSGSRLGGHRFTAFRGGLLYS